MRIKKIRSQFFMSTTQKLLIFILLISGFQANAQFQKHARFEFSTSAGTVAVGDEIDLVFRATIDKDWYLYSSDIDPDLGPTPTSVTLEEHPSFRTVGKLVPVGAQKKFDKIWEADITYFERRATFKQTVKILQKNPVIKGEIGFLTCSNVSGLCVPGDEEFTITGLQVSDAAPSPATREENTVAAKPADPAAKTDAAGKAGAADKVQLPENKDSVSIPEAETIPVPPVDTVSAVGIQQKGAENNESTSLWAFALTAFLAGLAALLTPCVFPVIPMTVTFFTKQKEGKKKALLYGAFIILIYTFIGVIVSRLNGPAFANFLSTHWIPNVFFFLVFCLLHGLYACTGIFLLHRSYRRKYPGSVGRGTGSETDSWHDCLLGCICHPLHTFCAFPGLA